MVVTLIGGEHAESLDKWKSKVPKKDYDLVATERIASHNPSKKLLRFAYQPISAFVLLLLNSKRILVHDLLGLNPQQNDNRAALEIAKSNDVNLLKIDASALKQIETFEFRNEKTIIDWFNLIVLYQLLTSYNFVFLDLLALVMFNLTIQLVATLWMYKNTRDQFMSEKIAENYEEGDEVAVFTGTLHTPAITGYLFSRDIRDIEVIGVETMLSNLIK